MHLLFLVNVNTLLKALTNMNKYKELLAVILKVLPKFLYINYRPNNDCFITEKYNNLTLTEELAIAISCIFPQGFNQTLTIH